jgi:VWFA-related protein
VNRSGVLAVLFRRAHLLWAAPAVVCLLVAAPAAFAQGGSATPPAAAPASTPQNDQANNSANNPAAAQPTLKVQGPLVVLDVVVTDSGGRPVHDLKAGDFTVLERGKKMAPQSFEEHRTEPAQPAAPAPAAQKAIPNFFTNYTETPGEGALNVLLLDALNTPLADQIYLRRQMLDYIAKLPAGTRIAIFGLSSRLYILQGFTSNPEILKAALSGKKNLAKDSPLLVSPQEADQQLNDNDDMSDQLGNDPNAAMVMANIQQFQADVATAQITLRVQYTLAGIDELARYLAGIPGRKNLIWLSGSFPLNIEPDGDLADPFQAAAQYADQVKDTADLLVRAQVAVYPVDARGLFVDPSLTAQVSGASFARNPQAMNKQMSKFAVQTASEHGTMDMIADETGGKAFYNTNGLTDAVKQAVDEGSNYYTITYQPDDTNWNGAYRNVRVNVDRSGSHLFYVHGYYADTPDAKVQGQKVLPLRPVQVAMMRGGPDPTQIVFAARIVAADGTEDKLPACNEPRDKEMKPPYRRYTILAAAKIGDMTFAMTPDGAYHGAFDFISVVYDPDGKGMNLCANTMHADLSAAQYVAMLKSGIRLRQEIDAPAKGSYFLRIGVHDLASDRVGALELPLSAVKPEPAATPASK